MSNAGKTTVLGTLGVTVTGGGLTVLSPGLTVSAGDLVSVGDANVGVGSVSVTASIASADMIKVHASASPFAGNAILGRLTGTTGNAMYLESSQALFRVSFIFARDIGLAPLLNFVILHGSGARNWGCHSQSFECGQ